MQDIRHDTVSGQVIRRAKLRTMVKVLPVVAHNFAAKGVEGINAHIVGVAANDTGQTFLHRYRATFGKCEAEDGFGQGIRLAQDVGSPHAEEFGFTRTRPRYHHNGAIDMVHGAALVGVEVSVAMCKIHTTIVAAPRLRTA